MPPVSLSSLRKGARGTVADVRDDAQSLGDEARSTVSRRLLELGFIPGEAFEVIGSGGFTVAQTFQILGSLATAGEFMTLEAWKLRLNGF